MVAGRAAHSTGKDAPVRWRNVTRGRSGCVRGDRSRVNSGCAWRRLPPSIGGHRADSPPSVHRMDRSRAVATAAPRGAGQAGQPRHDLLVVCALDGASVRAKKERTDRPEPGRPLQTRLEDPRSVRPGGPAPDRRRFRCHTHDSHALNPWSTHCRRSGPIATLEAGSRLSCNADKAYDIPALRAWLRRRGIIPRMGAGRARRRRRDAVLAVHGHVRGPADRLSRSRWWGLPALRSPRPGRLTSRLRHLMITKRGSICAP